MKHRFLNTAISLAALVLAILAMADPCQVHADPTEASP